MPAQVMQYMRVGRISRLAISFEQDLHVRNLSAKTRKIYLTAIEMLDEYLTTRVVPNAWVNADRIRDFIRELQERKHKRTGQALSAAYINNVYRSLQAFFTWAVREQHISESPMATLRPPKVVINPPPVLTQDDLIKLLDSCADRSFKSVRDTAIIWLLIDCGLRRAEIGNLKRSDFDFKNQTVKVTGKGSKERTVRYSRVTAKALDRYDLLRDRQSKAHDPAFWLGNAGAMTPDGIYQVIQRRAEQAGLARVWTHLFRHSWAHMFLKNGGNEGDLAFLAGWDPNSNMPRRYGASAAAERAREAHVRYSPAETLARYRRKQQP